MVDTTIQDVINMNIAFTQPAGDMTRLADNDHAAWDYLQKQSHLILEEFNELIEAIANKDINEVRDAICDILVVTIGAGHKAGMDIPKDMKTVFESNMSKFCENEDILNRTIQKYSLIGIDVAPFGEYPLKHVKTTADCYDKNGKFYPKGKFLKSVTFIEPKFD